jgi:dynein heavy chain
MDQNGWYDLKDNTHPFKKIVDTNIVAAMGPPGGGRAVITPRFQRHFNMISFVHLDEAQLETIFRSILKWHFREGKFVTEVANLEHKIVKATAKVFNEIQAELKPTPAKTHYTFNLRDFSAVICGMTQVSAKDLTSANQVIRLWAHETCRVFSDRLINNEDRMWMLDMCRSCFQNPFSA